MAEFDIMGNFTGGSSPEDAQQKPVAKAATPAAPAAAPVAKAPESTAAKPEKPAAASTAAIAPAAAVSASPAAPATPPPAANPAEAMSGAAPGGMGGIMQMIFMMIAQMFGINMTAMKQAQAAPAVQNKPALAAAAPEAAAPAGPKPSGPAPSPAQVKAVDNKIEADANPQPAVMTAAAAPAMMTTAFKIESDDQRRDRLGMSQKQFSSLASDESAWQAAARSEVGATGDSPFVKADKGDKLVQAKLGLDNAQWGALKQENQKWQTSVDGGMKAKPEEGPLYKKYMTALGGDAAQAPVATAEITEPAPQTQQPSPLRQANAMEQGSSSDQQPRRPAMPASRPEPMAMASQQARYEAPQNYGPARASFGSASGVDQLNRTLAERQEYRAQGYAPQLAKQMVDMNRRSEMAEQGYDARDINKQVGQISRMADVQEKQGLREDKQYEAAARRADRQYERDVGAVSRDAGRVGSILTDGNRRNDHRAVDTLVRNGVGALLGGGALSNVFSSRGRGDDSPPYRAAPAATQRDINAWSRDAGSIASTLTDGNSRNDHRATGTIVQRGVEAVLRGGIPGFSSDRPAQIYSAPPSAANQRGQQGFSFDRSNELREPYNAAGSQGLTAQERQQMFEAGRDRQQTATMEDQQPNNRRPFDNGFRN